MSDQFDRLKTALANRYAIQEELGAGGMATVYLAEDLKHHRKVAVKVLRPELAAALGPERFLREIKIAANLTHPHILPLHDSGEAAGFLYYVMPFLEGESLRDKMNRERQLGLDEVIKIGSAVASALDYAHRHDVIHRDIKPENILLHDGEAVVADFGIAVAVSEAGGERLTGTGLSVGTPHYMSPEQATADRALDTRSDIYSVGCVMYEMLTGDPPHTGTNIQALMAKIVTDDPISPTQFGDSVDRPSRAPQYGVLCRGGGGGVGTHQVARRSPDVIAASAGIRSHITAVTSSRRGLAHVAAARRSGRWAESRWRFRECSSGGCGTSVAVQR